VEGTRVVLDLGEVRGTAEVWLDGILIDTCPPDHGAPSSHRLAFASPTGGVLAGQTRHDLFGPVAIEVVGRGRGRPG
jgi:hypothetical protein